MTVIATSPISISVRFGDTGREVLTPPGSLAQLLNQLSGNANTGISIEEIDGFALAIIPYTDTLDTALQGLVDTFISLRYASGRVQLKLFTAEEV